MHVYVYDGIKFIIYYIRYISCLLYIYVYIYTINAYPCIYYIYTYVYI